MKFFYVVLLAVGIAQVDRCAASASNQGGRDTVPDSGATVLERLRESPTTVRDKLGVNFTWAADQRLTGDPAFASKSFRHARFFQMMEKDFAGGTPGTIVLEACSDSSNPWACVDQSMKQHLVRLKSLRSMFPNGLLWVAPEVLQNRSWPCKGWSLSELGTDPYLAGYRWGRAALATFGTLEGVILAMTNEEWCAQPGRVNAYNAWRRGIIQAHRENPSCQLAIGARHVRIRQWEGKRMPDNVGDVASDVWAYVDSTGGWADYHAHGIEHGRFLPAARAAEATDFKDFFAWSKWLDNNYPRIKKAVGEVAYTSSAPGVIPSDAEKQADWPVFKTLLQSLLREADLVFVYQIEDHGHPEGAFSGTGVYPALMDSIAIFGAQALEQ